MVDNQRFTAKLDITPKGTTWWAVGQEEPEQWTTYHKLEAIFEARSRTLAQLAQTLLTSVSMGIAAPIALWAYQGRSGARAPLLVIVGIAVFIGSAMSSANFLLSPRTVVVFRNSYEQAARREERNSKLLFAALGSVLGAATTLLGIYAKHKLWVIK
jgi:hypothetical protein